jgi:hypothetical protein
LDSGTACTYFFRTFSCFTLGRPGADCVDPPFLSVIRAATSPLLDCAMACAKLGPPLLWPIGLSENSGPGPRSFIPPIELPSAPGLGLLEPAFDLYAIILCGWPKPRLPTVV